MWPEPSGGRTAVKRSQTSTGQWTVDVPQPLFRDSPISKETEPRELPRGEQGGDRCRAQLGSLASAHALCRGSSAFPQGKEWSLPLH